MKLAFIATVTLIISASAASAQYGSSNRAYGIGSNPSSTYVQPYINRNGTIVDGHYRTTPNGNTLDNFNTRPNYNPHNGRTGTRYGQF